MMTRPTEPPYIDKVASQALAACKTAVYYPNGDFNPIFWDGLTAEQQVDTLLWSMRFFLPMQRILNN